VVQSNRGSRGADGSQGSIKEEVAGETADAGGKNCFQKKGMQSTPRRERGENRTRRVGAVTLQGKGGKRFVSALKENGLRRPAAGGRVQAPQTGEKKKEAGNASGKVSNCFKFRAPGYDQMAHPETKERIILVKKHGH